MKKFMKDDMEIVLSKHRSSVASRLLEEDEPAAYAEQMLYKSLMEGPMANTGHVMPAPMDNEEFDAWLDENYPWPVEDEAYLRWLEEQNA
mgnify:FL=1